MGSLVLVSGAPGSGKTTVARALAEASDRGLHFVSDTFYEFIPKLIPPTDPASQHQNTVVMNALAQASRTLAEGGYDVYLDGVIGPWFLDVFRGMESEEFGLSYLVLRASEAASLQRVRQREGPGMSPGVSQMSGAFADLGPFESHALDTTAIGPEEVFSEAQAGLASGRYRLAPGFPTQ